VQIIADRQHHQVGLRGGVRIAGPAERDAGDGAVVVQGAEILREVVHPICTDRTFREAVAGGRE